MGRFWATLGVIATATELVCVPSLYLFALALAWREDWFMALLMPFWLSRPITDGMAKAWRRGVEEVTADMEGQR